MYISILFLRKQATHTRAHTKSSLGCYYFLLLWSSALLSVLVLIFFVTIFLCSVFVSRSFAAALPFQRL